MLGVYKHSSHETGTGVIFPVYGVEEMIAALLQAHSASESLSQCYLRIDVVCDRCGDDVEMPLRMDRACSAHLRR
jgi:hypothetical protein